MQCMYIYIPVYIIYLINEFVCSSTNKLIALVLLSPIYVDLIVIVVYAIPIHSK